MEAALKRVVGRPFPKGVSGNPSGRARDPLLAALRGKMTPERAATVAEMLLSKAEAGDIQATAMVWERMAGKVPNRNEDGKPGDFEMDLDDKDRAKLRSALREIRGRCTG